MIIMKKFPDNSVRWDWPRSALPENKEQVDDFQLAFKIFLWKINIFGPN